MRPIAPQIINYMNDGKYIKAMGLWYVVDVQKLKLMVELQQQEC